MKIAIWHNLPSGGGKRALADQVCGLTERGHTLEIWSPTTANSSYLPLAEHAVPPAKIVEHVLPLAHADLARFPKWQRVLRLPGFIQRNIRAMDAHCKRCADEINAGNFDLLFAASCQFYRVTSIAKYVRARKIIYLQEPYRWLYEAMPEQVWLAPQAGAPLKTRVRDWVMTPMFRAQMRYEQDSARAYDRILVNSYFSRESVLRAYGLDASVCYLGVDTAQFADMGLPRERMVVGVGAFVPEKNIVFVIHAIGAIPQHLRPMLVWVGNTTHPPYLQHLRDLAQQLGVNFAPQQNISQTDLVRWLNRASLMAYAPRLEPFGYAPLEANACGLPVVAVAEGGVRETVLDGVNGRLVPAEIPAFADAVTQFMAHPSLIADYGQRAKAYVTSHWGQKQAIDRLEEMMR
jgi:glycosyltransferase involved in cell wall biosynthesis